MKFLLGSKEEFFDFVNSISKEDNVALLTHNDLDGIASVIFLEEILNKKGIKIKFIDFLGYKPDVLDLIYPKLKSKKINKIFLTDFGIDLSFLDVFEKLRKDFDVFLIDHHQINPKLKNTKNIIKTESGDCSSYTIYNLGDFGKQLGWLVCSSMISDMAYHKKETLDFIKNFYPKINLENIYNSIPSEISKDIASALVYYKDNIIKVYELVKNENLKELKHCREIIDLEIKRLLSDFEKNTEFYSEKDIYLYIFNSKFDINSILSTILSQKNPNSSFIIAHNKNDGFLYMSARDQSKKVDMNKLMQKGIKGLKNAVGGGHIPAAGGRIMKKDLEKFKENILNS